MISARYSNLSKRLLSSLIVTGSLLCAHPVFAQSQNGYAPPPMFDDMTPPMVRPKTENGYIVEPKSSTAPKLPPPSPAAQKPPVILPRVSVDPDSQRAAMPPPQKPAAPQRVSRPPAPPVKPQFPVVPVAPTQPPAMPVAKPSVPPSKPAATQPEVKEVYIKRDKPAVEKPAALAKPAIKPTMKPAAPDEPSRTVKIGRDPNVSAIKGPKTMPALPAQDVDGEVTFEAKVVSPSEPTILERQQQQALEKKKEETTLMPVVPRPKDGVTPASFEKADQGALKKSFVFEPGQITMADAETDAVAAGVVKQLDDDEKEDWRVQIKSYATPYGNGLSSDRRIALSRALSLRSSLITQGVSASRIDVLAEGLQTEGEKPGDRIDLYLYEPAAN